MLLGGCHGITLWLLGCSVIVVIGHLFGCSGCFPEYCSTQLLFIGRVLLRGCYVVPDSCQDIAKRLLGYSE